MASVNDHLKSQNEKLSTLSDQTMTNTSDIKQLSEAFEKDSKSCQLDRDDLRKLLQQLQDRLNKLESTKITGQDNNSTLKDILERLA